MSEKYEKMCKIFRKVKIRKKYMKNYKKCEDILSIKNTVSSDDKPQSCRCGGLRLT